MSSREEALAAGYAACEALARSRYENFPVASRLLPSSMRPHVAAVYAFARVADDIADEGTESSADRRARLDAWGRRLHEAIELRERHHQGDPRAGGDDALLFALAHTIRSYALPVSLFDDLLSAFAQDTMTNRYESWADVFDYCRRSANPVGRIVLRIAGRDDDKLDRSSDALCTALQLVNFWQDFGRDWRHGRLYVPREVYEASGADIADLTAGRMTAAWVGALERCALVTRQRFEEGRSVCDGIRGRLRWELRLTWLGGRRILEKVERHAGRLLDNRPTLGPTDVPTLLWRAVRWPTA
jgi:phytoene synthase